MRSLSLARTSENCDMFKLCKKSCILNIKGEKTMKRFLGAIALACVFSISALGGELPTSGVTSPAPGELPTSGISSTSPTAPSPGELPTGGFADQLSDAALTALLSVLGLLAV
jgi:hypothetical protein